MVCFACGKYGDRKDHCLEFSQIKEASVKDSPIATSGLAPTAPFDQQDT